MTHSGETAISEKYLHYSGSGRNGEVEKNFFLMKKIAKTSSLGFQRD